MCMYMYVCVCVCMCVYVCMRGVYICVFICVCVSIFCNIDYVYNVSEQMLIGVVQDTIEDSLLHFAKEGTLVSTQSLH